MHVNVRNVDVGRVRVGVCMLCVSDSEEREHGVGVYYEALKRELIKTKTIYGFRCDERLENSI